MVALVMEGSGRRLGFAALGVLFRAMGYGTPPHPNPLPPPSGKEGIKNTGLRGGDKAIDVQEVAVRVLEIGGAVAPGEGGGGQDEVDLQTDTV